MRMRLLSDPLEYTKADIDIGNQIAQQNADYDPQQSDPIYHSHKQRNRGHLPFVQQTWNGPGAFSKGM